jgi:predicted dehydrogenase
METSERRNFIKNSGLATAAILAAPMIIQSCKDQTAPSDKINLAVIGAGNQGSNDTMGFLEDGRVQVTAICDVNTRSKGYWFGAEGGREYLREKVEAFYSEKTGKTFKGVREFTDFQEVLERKDIDAVLIATPDHWHSIPVMIAAHNKKGYLLPKTFVPDNL